MRLGIHASTLIHKLNIAILATLLNRSSLSKPIEVLLRVAEVIAQNARLTFITLGVFAMLIGWALGAGWIIILGFCFLVVGIVCEESSAELAKPPVH